MHMLTTAITDGLAMLRNALMPNPNRGNIEHQFQTMAMQSNGGHMPNDAISSIPSPKLCPRANVK